MNNLRLALRSLAKTPGFTLLAILSLAVGIGINSTIFSAMDAAFLRPLPVKNSEEIVKFERPRLTVPEFEQVRAEVPALAYWSQRQRLQPNVTFEVRSGLPPLALAKAGLAVGLPAALAIGHVVKSQLYGVSPIDPPTIVGGVVVLLAVTLLACWLPAHRATRVDPLIALRAE